MKVTAADRLWLAGIAVVAAAILILAPLATGALAADGKDVRVALVNLQTNPIDDGALAKALEKDKVDGADWLIISMPSADNQLIFGCTDVTLPKSCPILRKVTNRVDVPPGVDPITTVNGLFGSGDPPSKGSLVRIADREAGDDFDGTAALEAGLVMTIIAAGSFYFAARSTRWRYWPWRVQSTAAEGIPDDVRRAVEPRPERTTPAPAPRRPEPRRPPVSAPPADPPGPLPRDVREALGRRVVARTLFGSEGGYVDANGMTLWAHLENPGERVYPGQPLAVLTMTPGNDAIVVSSRVTEEVHR
ncbi:hypothetical protein [Actinoplanes sp. NPDC051411]|uniref:hypothetical protein n=1 Tax=Actinoplanes sp. NPDC051411 TaxID=3155522 RepID=UPI00343F44A4